MFHELRVYPLLFTRGKHIPLGIHATLGEDTADKSRSLLDLSVNADWNKTAAELDDMDAVTDDATVVSDGDSGIVTAFTDESHDHQLDLVHVGRTLDYYLWDDGIFRLVDLPVNSYPVALLVSTTVIGGKLVRRNQNTPLVCSFLSRRSQSTAGTDCRCICGMRDPIIPCHQSTLTGTSSLVFAGSALFHLSLILA